MRAVAVVPRSILYTPKPRHLTRHSTHHTTSLHLRELQDFCTTIHRVKGCKAVALGEWMDPIGQYIQPHHNCGMQRAPITHVLHVFMR